MLPPRTATSGARPSTGYAADETVDDGSPEDVLWTLTDHQNTVRDMVKYDGGNGEWEVANHVTYESFGKVATETTPAVDTLFMYTGRVFDATTELQNNGHRWYDLVTARWASEDPIGVWGGDTNFYRYCSNGPDVRIDPSGLAGHHWVPQAVTNAVASVLTPEAYWIFMQGTNGPMPYNHGFDDWGGVSHKKYNDAVKSLIQKYRKALGRRLTANDANRLLTWIESGKCSNQKFLAANEDAFRTIWGWRKGFLQSVSVAEAAAARDAKLTRAELKAIAKYLVNGETSTVLSRRAKGVLKGLTKLGVKRAAMKLLPVLTALAIANAAANGYAGENEHGLSGAAGEGMKRFVN